MVPAFVLGNGISRLGLPLDDLRQRGPVFGCNAIYREFIPDVLVATDLPIATAIQDSGYPSRHRFYTRKPRTETGAIRVPQDYYGYSSGPIAVALAAMAGHERIYLIGFDLGPGKNNSFNNVYAGTEFYKPRDALPTFTGNWIRQIQRIAKDFPKATFVRVYGPTTAQIEELQKLSNMQHWDFTILLDRINNKEDL